MGGRTRPASHARIHSPQAGVKNVLQLRHGQIIHPYLTDLGNHDEAFTRHVQGIRLLDVARQHEHQPVPRIDAIVGIHRTREIGVELRRRVAEEIQPEDDESAIDVDAGLRDAAIQRIVARGTCEPCCLSPRCHTSLVHRRVDESGSQRVGDRKCVRVHAAPEQLHFDRVCNSEL